MRCPKCNKNVSKLIRGVCTGCISMNIMSVKKSADMRNNETDSELESPSKVFSNPGEFARITKETQALQAKIDKSSNNGNIAIENVDTKFNTEYNDVLREAVLSNRLTEEDLVLSMPSLKVLFRKYRPQLVQTYYLFCHTNDYSILNNKMCGAIIEIKGNICVIENKFSSRYIDRSERVIVDPYESDTALIDIETYGFNPDGTPNNSTEKKSVLPCDIEDYN